MDKVVFSNCENALQCRVLNCNLSLIRNNIRYNKEFLCNDKYKKYYKLRDNDLQQQYVYIFVNFINSFLIFSKEVFLKHYDRICRSD